MNAKFTFVALCLALVSCFTTGVNAATTSMTFQPNPVDLNDLDHHDVYAWRIDNIDLTNVSLTGASITFKNIENWDSNPNMLFVWLLDTAIHPGVATTEDVDANQAPVTDIADAFLGSLPTLLSSSTAKTKLFQKSFTTSPQTYTYNFTAAQLTTLQNYIANGHDIALGFDPDCHFFNDGISFTMTMTPVPEIAPAIPAFCLIILAIGLDIRRRGRSAG